MTEYGRKGKGEKPIPVLFVDENIGICLDCDLPDCKDTSPRCPLRVAFVKARKDGSYKMKYSRPLPEKTYPEELDFFLTL